MRDKPPFSKRIASFAPRLWSASMAAEGRRSTPDRFCAVVGLHSSGSSAMAGVLYHLGVYLGRKLGGHYGRDVQATCGFEAKDLATICETAIPFPSSHIVQQTDVVTANLAAWINKTEREATRLNTLPGGKYPLLCRLGPQLVELCGNRLRVIHIDRLLYESVESLKRRCPQQAAETLETHQRWLWNGKQELFKLLPPEAVLTVTYDQLLRDPRAVARRAADFLGLQVSAPQLDRAARSVKTDMRHVRTA